VEPRTTSLYYGQAHYFEVLCGIPIRVSAPTAEWIGAGKALAMTVTEMQTTVTHLGGIRGRQQDDQHRGQRRFVVDKGPQLVERPTIASAAFVWASRLLIGPLAYPRQILQRQQGLLLGCFGDQCFADDVVRLSLKPFLAPRQPCQELTATPPGTPGAFRGFLLECRPQATVAITYPRDVVARPGLPRTRMGNVASSQIDPNGCVRGVRSVDGEVQLDMHGVRTIRMLTQLGGFRCGAFQLPTLIVPWRQRQPFPAMQQRETDRHIAFAKTEDAGIVLNTGRAKLLHGMAGFMRRFAVHGDTANSLNGEICRQAKLAPHVVIDHRLHPVFVADVRWQRRMDVGTRIGKARQRLIQPLRLLVSWLESAYQCNDLFHSDNSITMMTSLQESAKAWKAFPLLPLKRRIIHGLKSNFVEHLASHTTAQPTPARRRSCAQAVCSVCLKSRVQAP
jgi:hypothetical protein